MASSNVIFTGPCPCANMPVGHRSVRPNATQTTSEPMDELLKSKIACLTFKGFLRFWQFVALTRKPHVKGRQNEYAHGQSDHQSAHDDNRKRPLRIGAYGVGHRRRQQAESSH